MTSSLAQLVRAAVYTIKTAGRGFESRMRSKTGIKNAKQQEIIPDKVKEE